LNKRIIIQSIGSFLAIVALSFGFKVSVPDAVSVSYGFPLNWGLHQLVTIAGPVDIWSININNLIIDLVVWLLLILVIPIIADKILRK